MHRPHVIHAWKWLLAQLLVAAAVGYLATLLLADTGVAQPQELLRTTTTGLRHVGGPIVSSGTAFGFDEGIMIFFCNLTVALLIVGLVQWVRLFDPREQGRSFARLRRHLQRDRSAEFLLQVPPFARIRSAQMRLTSFLLLGAPCIAAVTIGLMAGVLLGSIQLVTSSPLIALAYLLPHGIPELAGLILACSIPVATWRAIRPVADQEPPVLAFRRIERVLASQQFQRDLKMIINLLLIAGQIEAHFTLRVVALLSGG